MSKRKVKWAKGPYKVKNPDKYIGTYVEGVSPIYRSSWELTFMRFCDENPNVLSWASEPLKIPYYNPLKQKQSIYVPDFLICYQNKTGEKKVEMIEIKPMGQTVLTEKSSEKEKRDIIVNNAKWKEAVKFCRMRDIDFRILTKEDIYLK